MIDDSDEEMQDAMVTMPSKGKDHSYILVVIQSEQSHANHVAETPRQSEKNTSAGFLPDINVQPISKASANIAKDRCRDIEQFFSPLVVKDGKNYRNCCICL